MLATRMDEYRLPPPPVFLATRSTGAVDSVVAEFRKLPNGKRRRRGQRHDSRALSSPCTLPGDRRPENICVPDGDRHIFDRRNCTTESFRPKTECDDRTVYVSTTGATPRERVREYITTLHELVANCNFGQLSDELIRDQLIEKTNNPRVRERLLMEPDTLTLEKAITPTSRIEVALNESLTITKSVTRATDSTMFETPRDQAVQAKSQYCAAKLNRSTHTATNTRVQVPCDNCGYSSHATGSAKCSARAKTCRLCSKINHCEVLQIFQKGECRRSNTTAK